MIKKLNLKKMLSPMLLASILSVGFSTNVYAADYKIVFSKIYVQDDANRWGSGKLYLTAYLDGEPIIQNRNFDVNARGDRSRALGEVKIISAADTENILIKVEGGQDAIVVQDDRCYGEVLVNPLTTQGEIIIPCKHKVDDLFIKFYVFIKKIS